MVGDLLPCYGSHTVEIVQEGRAGTLIPGRQLPLAGARGPCISAVGRATVGSKGAGDGEFRLPTGLALLPDIGLVVREEGGSRVRVLRLQFRTD